MDQQALALTKISYGLYVLSTRVGEKDNGCIVNTVVQAASSPCQITVAVSKQNYTCEMIQASGVFDVCPLAEDAPFDTFRHFGFQSGREVDKFASIPWQRSANGVAYPLEHTVAVFSCKVTSSVDLGSHMLFIATLEDAQVLSEAQPVTYAYYHRSIKPVPQPIAAKGYRCTICGYVYEGDELPPDFVCPICKHGAADFEKIV